MLDSEERIEVRTCQHARAAAVQPGLTAVPEPVLYAGIESQPARHGPRGVPCPLAVHKLRGHRGDAAPLQLTVEAGCDVLHDGPERSPPDVALVVRSPRVVGAQCPRLVERQRDALHVLVVCARAEQEPHGPRPGAAARRGSRLRAP